MSTKILTAKHVREAWIEFWRLRLHTSINSASLIPTHPTAPMFTNSGMMQFVPYFLGEEKVPFTPPRATSIQKCVRAGGKHNDLDVIGKSLRHLSFFEMLGNFSFGDYFKRDAIIWAWEFVTEVLKIEENRLWVTVHTSDNDAADIWHNEVGLPLERIQRLDKDNFWEMGEIGPCGPSSELFYDFGSEYGPDGGPQNPQSQNRYIEFWNLVFMQFFRDKSGNLTPLPLKHVDTGAGLERIVGLLNGSPSLFACDTLSPLVDLVSHISHYKIGENDKEDIAMRIIADHSRSATFLLSDGVIPSNEGNGYVLRRIIRRAIRFAYLLNIKSEIMSRMAREVIKLHKEVYPELVINESTIVTMLTREETKFRKTLITGLEILEAELKDIPKGGVLSGKLAYLLYDTHGFPLEITMEVASENGYEVNVAEFRELMKEQRTRGRSSTKTNVSYTNLTDYQQILELYGKTNFIGRTEYSCQAKVVGLIKAKDSLEIFLDRTPFYAEQGGQVGDQGTLNFPNLDITLDIQNTTQPIPGLYSHHVLKIKKNIIESIQIGDSTKAKIDIVRREKIQRNHTATHLIHWALRKILGNHVKQQGSLVNANRLRFDFSHFEPISESQISMIEDLVNLEVISGVAVKELEMSKQEALSKGAMALFNEKYGDRVRVIEAGPHSLELCGGTHVKNLGQIGIVKITSESSIGDNLRRIVAVSGTEILKIVREQYADMKLFADKADISIHQLKDGLLRRLDDYYVIREKNNTLLTRLEEVMANNLISQAKGPFLIELVRDVESETLTRLAVKILDKANLKVVILGSVNNFKRPIVAAAVANNFKIGAGELLEPISKLIGGGHGKHNKIALAGGSDSTKLKEALEAARSYLNALD